MAYPTNVEMIDAILCVADLERSLRYYTDVLGFEAAPWNTGDFTAVTLEGHGLYLAENSQGHPGSWIWIGVGNVRVLHEHYQAKGAIIRLPPTQYPWALELQIEDPDGNVIRFGSAPDD